MFSFMLNSTYYMCFVVACIVSYIFAIYMNMHYRVLPSLFDSYAMNKNGVRSDYVFDGTAFAVKSRTYEIYRAIGLVLIILIGLAAKRNDVIGLGVFIYLITVPLTHPFGIQGPFASIDEEVRKWDRTKKDTELIKVLFLMKNMMVQLRNKPKGAAYILDYVIGTTTLTRVAFLSFYNAYATGAEKEAALSFEEEIGTELSAEVAGILLEIDKVSPDVIENKIESIQNEIRETNSTAKQNQDATISNALLIPIMATIVFELLNFLNVVYLGNLNSLGDLFGTGFGS